MFEEVFYTVVLIAVALLIATWLDNRARRRKGDIHSQTSAADRRAFLDRKAEVERDARKHL